MDPRYEEWPVAPALRGHVVCSWAGRLGDDGSTYTSAVLPDGCIDLVWDGAHLFVAGPDTGPVTLDRRPGASYAGIRFRPGLAPTMLGVPASALLDQRVDATAVLGRRTDPLAEQVAAAPSPRAAAAALEAGVTAWLPDAAPSDPLVEGLVTALRRSPGSHRVGLLADALGVGERQLHRRCTAAVGYGPKVLDRVVRFRRFLGLGGGARRGRGLAALAVESGYADQAHLTRECRRLAGTTPRALLGSTPVRT